MRVFSFFLIFQGHMRHNYTQVSPRHRSEDSNCCIPSTVATLNYARALIRDFIGFFSGAISAGQFHPFKLHINTLPSKEHCPDCNYWRDWARI